MKPAETNLAKLWKNCREIERVQATSQAEFEKKYILSNQGLGQPVIITDATKQWPALEKWSFDFFRKEYGDLEILCWYINFRVRPIKRWYAWTKLKNYLNYIFNSPDKQPKASPMNTRYISPRFPNISKADSEPWPLPDNAALYYSDLLRRPEFEPLFEDFDTELYFLDDLFQHMPGKWKHFMLHTHYTPFFIGPAGTRTHLHSDYWNSETVFFNIRGRKHYICFSPSDTAALCDKAHAPIDPRNPDWKHYPNSKNIIPYQGIIGPGDCIFMPPNWTHDVLALEPSISITWSVCTKHNFGNFMNNLLSDPKQIADILACNPKFLQTTNLSKARPFVRTVY